jgi:hypothetical protein
MRPSCPTLSGSRRGCRGRVGRCGRGRDRARSPVRSRARRCCRCSGQGSSLARRCRRGAAGARERRRRARREGWASASAPRPGWRPATRGLEPEPGPGPGTGWASASAPASSGARGLAWASPASSAPRAAWAPVARSGRSPPGAGRRGRGGTRGRAAPVREQGRCERPRGRHAARRLQVTAGRGAACQRPVAPPRPPTRRRAAAGQRWLGPCDQGRAGVQEGGPCLRVLPRTVPPPPPASKKTSWIPPI